MIINISITAIMYQIINTTFDIRHNSFWLISELLNKWILSSLETVTLKVKWGKHNKNQDL